MTKRRNTNLAKRALKAYRWAKSFLHFSPKKAAGVAHFQMTVGRNGAANLLGQNRVRKYQVYWDGRDVEEAAKLKAAFDLVCDKKNWKEPINKILQVDPETRALIEKAIVFYTGGVATVKRVAPSTYRFTAAGYYVSVGA